MFIAPGFYEHVVNDDCMFHSENKYDMMNAYEKYSNGFSSPEYFKIRKGKYAGSIGRLGFHDIWIDDDTYLPLLIPKNMEWLPNYQGQTKLCAISNDKFKLDSNGVKLKNGDDVLFVCDNMVRFGIITNYNSVLNMFEVETETGSVTMNGCDARMALTDWTMARSKVTMARLSK